MNLFLTLIFSLLIGFYTGTFNAKLSAFESIEVNELKTHNNQADSCVIVIFGASGDLTSRKLLPAIYNLTHEGHLSNNTVVVGFARNELTDQTFRKQMKGAVDQFAGTYANDVGFWDQFKNRLFYVQGDFEQDHGYENLQKLLLQLDQQFGTRGNRIYYFATYSSHVSTIIKKLQQHQLVQDADNSDKNWSRFIIEKPFGYDLDSASLLQNDISHTLDDRQVYRIDHYLAKEGVQNLFTLRFESGLFEPLWNSEHIDNVQITLAEELGIGTRAQFWEETGSLRDVLQNHLLQLLAIVAMEPPFSLNASDVHKEKIKVLNAIRPFSSTEMDQSIIRAQYGPGIIRGIEVLGYKQEKDVSENSTSETFIAAQMFIDNPRWNGVPFYIRGGKRLPKQTTEIAITFKNPNHAIDQPSNVLFIRIQPNAGVFLKTLSKVPMLEKSLKPITFGYQPDSYFKTSSPEAYEKLLYDCAKGDSCLYVKGEEQLAAWRLLTPVLNHWKSHSHETVQMYDAGTWGPSTADQLLKRNGHQWHLLEN